MVKFSLFSIFKNVLLLSNDAYFIHTFLKKTNTKSKTRIVCIREDNNLYVDKN